MMVAVYTVERIDDGVELRLSREHAPVVRIWVNDSVAGQLLSMLTGANEARMRKEMRHEYDLVIARVIALFRAVMDGKPGGSITAPDDYASHLLPFLN